MLTKAAKYAVRASLYLAINSSKKNKIGAKEIATVSYTHLTLPTTPYV